MFCLLLSVYLGLVVSQPVGGGGREYAGGR